MQRYRNARRAVKRPWRRLPPERLLRLVLAHAIIVLCGMYIVFYVLDHNGRSKSMNFINNEITKGLLLVLVLLSILNAVLALVRMHKGIGEKNISPVREAPRPQERPAYRQPSANARPRAREYSSGTVATPRHDGGQNVPRPASQRSSGYSGRHSSGY